jgi:hypothetical protein
LVWIQVEPAINPAAEAKDDEDEILFNDFAEIDQELRRAGQLGTKSRVNVAEHRDDFDEQEDRDGKGHEVTTSDTSSPT